MIMKLSKPRLRMRPSGKWVCGTNCLENKTVCGLGDTPEEAWKEWLWLNDIAWQSKQNLLAKLINWFKGWWK